LHDLLEVAAVEDVELDGPNLAVEILAVVRELGELRAGLDEVGHLFRVVACRAGGVPIGPHTESVSALRIGTSSITKCRRVPASPHDQFSAVCIMNTRFTWRHKVFLRSTGIVSSMRLTLIVLPALYRIVHGRASAG
jgi:hypothetical protein